MLLLVKDTKFESKSQPPIWLTHSSTNCFYWSKIQNLKANHNRTSLPQWVAPIAFTGQRYKIWKQITTACCNFVVPDRLLLLVKDTKFESKSQLTGKVLLLELDCFYWSKIQNLKANHNCRLNFIFLKSIAFTGQRYKIWKQITTARRLTSDMWSLLLLVKDTKFESKSQQLVCIVCL